MAKVGKQICQYISIGISAVILDAIIYTLCLKLLFFSLTLAKLTGVISSVVYGYILNSKWTFSCKTSLRNIVSYCVVYSLSIALNVITNRFLVEALPDRLFPLVTAFCIATALSVCINFLGMKFWVFRQSEKHLTD